MHSLEIVQWDSTRRDHPGYPGRVSGSGLVTQTTPIWVITHTQTKHKDLLGFFLNPNSITCNLTMNPTSKGGFHTYLVPYGVLLTLILINLGLGRNSNKTLERSNAKQESLYPRLLHTTQNMYPYKSIQNSIPFCSSLPLLFSSSSLSLPLLLLLPLFFFLYGFLSLET